MVLRHSLPAVMLGTLLLFVPMVGATSAMAEPEAGQAQPGVEKADKSLLTGVDLDGAVRLTRGEELETIRKQLGEAVQKAGGRRGADEVLLWTAPTYTGPASAAKTMDAVAAAMKGAGYQYEVTEGEGGSAILVARKGESLLLTGLWLKTDEVLLLAWCRVEKEGAAAGDKAGDAVLVPGNPPLTRKMVEHTCHFLAYLLEAPLTVEQRAKLEKSFIEDWRRKDTDTIEFVKDACELREQIFAKNEAERDLIRKQIQPELLKALRANKDDAGARWVLDIYDAAHKPIAPGNPPLTRQMTDAYTEVFFFMASEVVGEKLTPDTDAKTAFAKGLASGYATTPAEMKATLAKMPILWAAIRVAWPTLPEAEKQAAREQWTKDFKALVPGLPAPSAAKPAGGAAQGGKPALNDAAAIARQSAALQAMQNAYRIQNQVLWQNHYSRMNTINTWGGNPYRYVNAYGNPY